MRGSQEHVGSLVRVGLRFLAFPVWWIYIWAAIQCSVRAHFLLFFRLIIKFGCVEGFLYRCIVF